MAGSYILLVLAMTFCLRAIAAPNAGDAEITRYPAAYFSGAQPQTALDMVRRVPGFNFDGGDDDVRGYAGSTGNVLIDGQRPASKYDDLERVLERIPATAVVRVDRVRGSYAGVDMQGQTVVVNVVRRVDASASGRAAIGLYAHGDGRRLPEGTVEASRRWGDRLLEGAIHGYKLADDDSGNGDYRRRDVSGLELRHADSDLSATDKGMRLSGAYEQGLAGGRLRLTSSLHANRGSETDVEQQDYPTTASSIIAESKDTRQSETGLHFSRDFGKDSTVEVFAIRQRIDTDELESKVEEGAAETADTESDAGETILRGSVRTALARGIGIEWGAEGARNFLDSRSVSRENDELVPLPAASVRVEELRGEIFGQASWDILPAVSIELGTAFEVSRLRQTGDSQDERSFRYVKPGALLGWHVSARDNLYLRVQRTVGQLDFDDFVSSTEFSTGTVDAGNPELEPSTAWEFTATWERQLRNDATVVLTARHSRIAKVVDIVPVYADTNENGMPELFAGVGNIGNGRLGEVAVTLNLPLERLGIAGGLLKGDIALRHTSVMDPVSGERRPISGMTQPREGEIEFSQDLPRYGFRWGAQVKFGESQPEFRLDETRSESEGAWFGLFAEFSPTASLRLSVEAQNLSRRTEERTRNLYSASRDIGQLEAIEHRSRRFAPYLVMQIEWRWR